MKHINQFLILLLLSSSILIESQPIIIDHKNIIDQLAQDNIWNPSTPLKLHLGCGESHLNGYVNLDFPSSEHTVQTRQGADAFADITKIAFPSESVDEVRSHHTFEHFDRQAALALLCKWHDWLKVGGTLVIETPDFEGSMQLLMNSRYSYTQKQSIMRHVFGSHEAHWAMHYDGWYKDKFEHVLSALGFTNIYCEFTQWQLTKNIIVRAQKTAAAPAEIVQHRAKQILRDSMVDNSSSEEKMWQTWCSLFDTLLEA